MSDYDPWGSDTLSDQDIIDYIMGQPSTGYQSTDPIDYGGITVNPDGTVTSSDGSFGVSDVLKGIQKLLSGKSSLGQLGATVAAGGLNSMLDKLFNKPTGPAGYRGGIPQYTASFTQTPAAQQRPTTTTTAPDGTTKTVPYRPGQGGVTYFNPIQYTHTGRNLATPTVVPAAPPTTDTATANAKGGYMDQGIAMLAKGGNGNRFLRGGGDGTSDSIPAKFDGSGQPARLADGEFVVDARTVSELGNGSSEAGARKLYAMMDRVHKARKTAKRGKPSGADKFLPK